MLPPKLNDQCTLIIVISLIFNYYVITMFMNENSEKYSLVNIRLKKILVLLLIDTTSFHRNKQKQPTVAFHTSTLCGGPTLENRYLSYEILIRQCISRGVSRIVVLCQELLLSTVSSPRLEVVVKSETIQDGYNVNSYKTMARVMFCQEDPLPSSAFEPKEIVFMPFSVNFNKYLIQKGIQIAKYNLICVPLMVKGLLLSHQQRNVLQLQLTLLPVCECRFTNVKLFLFDLILI